MGLFNQSYVPERYALNRVDGVKTVHLRGFNPDISTSSETIMGVGGVYVQLTSAVAFEAVSSDANDTAAGTGARTIVASMVDGNYVQTDVTITMNGTTAVAISGTYLACNGARVATSGSNATNVGSIDIRTTAGSVVKRRIPAVIGSGKDQDFIYTIPAGHVGLLKPIHVYSAGAAAALNTFLQVWNSSGNVVTEAISMTGFSTISQCFATVNLGDGLRIEEKSLIDLKAFFGSGNNIVVAMGQLLVFNTAKLS